MSASPSQTTNPAKRPLEDASSPSRANDQPDAKRPALDKVTRNGHDEEHIDTPENNGATPPPETNGSSKNESVNGDEPKTDDAKDDQGDTIVPDATNESKPVGNAITAGAGVPAMNPNTNTHDETAWIHVRAVISSPEAATIIGKGGENVSNIRKQSGAKCTVSDYQKGAVERILTVSGVVDAMAKVCTLRFTPGLSHANGQCRRLA
jgi:heterogeneous nuclear rnp K-like protein 2